MNAKTLQDFILSVLFVLCLSCLCFCLETDTLTTSLSIRDPDTIESPGRIFRLGFFSPDNTTGRYLAVFYSFSQQTVVWVANRDSPLADSSGTVAIARDGNLVLRNGRNETVWSTNATSPSSPPVNATAKIEDTGNLVLRDNSTGNIIWQSFRHPSNVFLPNMEIIDNVTSHTKVVLTAWKNETDPEVGIFSAGLEALNIPQIFIWRNGRPHWRSGPWNGQILIGFWQMYTTYGRTSIFRVMNDQAGTYNFSSPLTRFTMKITLDSTGRFIQTMWDDQMREWGTSMVAPLYRCDVYGTCGSFGSCNRLESPMCSCLTGFEPMNREEWERGNWSGGCVRTRQLQCNGDGFLRLPFMKVPDFAEQFPSGQLDECRTRCSSNCSCLAYAHDPNIGCMFWRDSLVDVVRFDGVGVDLYIRLASSELGNRTTHKDRKLVIIIPVVAAFVAICAFVFVAWCWLSRRKVKSGDHEEIQDNKTFEVGQTFASDSTAIVLKDENKKVNIEEMPLFPFETLANATDQFSEANLLGRGGFGPVYKGTLPNGKEIGVKRLSAASKQGMEEFMNEVVVISKLQHRNLVRLLGCCVEREEKMLIYEYMSKRSLDWCLFDSTHSSQKILDWKKRFSIMEGIGRGLLYLHRDSRLKIIHRDLKPSNVLLDESWNPKISDFGMARIFGTNEDHDNTARVVGTYGYMAPEYAMQGQFSEKSDVYSFGILMLEIISGKKNTQFYNQELSLSLIGCAWKFWSEDNVFAFVDQNIGSSNFGRDIMRCVHIGLLCIQEFPNDRPMIQTVLSMLSREIVDLPTPEQPIFAENSTRSHLENGTAQSTGQIGYSINELTLTVLDGR